MIRGFDHFAAFTGRLMEAGIRQHMQRAAQPLFNTHSVASLRFIRRHTGILMTWMLVFAILVAITWAWTLSTITQEKGEIERRMKDSAAAQVKSYAAQLDKTLAQLDYMLLGLKYQWEETAHAPDLAKLARAGLVPTSETLIFTIVDRSGQPITSSIPFDTRTLKVAERPFFVQHKADPDLGLLFTGPLLGMRTKLPKLILSRRLNAKDGSFDGLVVLAVDPSYLLAINNENAMHPNDIMSVRKADGTFIVGKTRDNPNVYNPFSNSNPEFSTLSREGWVDAQAFTDHQARMVAWQKAGNFPVVSMAGLAKSDRLQEYVHREHDLLGIAVTLTVLLFLLTSGIFAVLLSRRKKSLIAEETQASYRLATEGALESFYILRPIYDSGMQLIDLLIVDCNKQAAEFCQADKERLVGASVSAYFSDMLEGDILPAYRAAAANGFHEDELHVPAIANRPQSWVARRIVLTESGFAVTLRDISAAKAHEASLQQMAHTDALTSLPNRHWLTAHLPTALSQADLSQKKLAVLFIDLDDFKNLNDTQGHAAGDELLVALASRLEGVLRPQDSVARLGGDEFTLLLEAIEDRGEVIAVVDRIRETLRSPFVFASGYRHTIHATIGISLYPLDGNNGDTLLKHADIAMYAAKAKGKGEYQFFDTRLSAALLGRLTLQSRLQRAIEQDELVLYYQPRVCGKSGAVMSMEALVRWIHPGHGLVPPNEFIPVAEETGLIIPLGEQVIIKACAQLAQWKEQGLPLKPVSVNVAAQQIDEGSVSAVLASALEKYGLSSDLIEIEVTESATVSDSTVAARELNALREMGCRLYVDDFGTGYSSLSQLRRLDMHGLKVDRAFTSGLAKRAEDVELFRAIISMAHALGMHVVAEGVETTEQLEILQGLNCDEMQGYLFSRPVPANDVAALLQEQPTE